MKTLLIPTDFKPESVNCIPELLKKVYPDKLNIIMVHIMDITDSIQELLMLSRRSSEYQLISSEFYQACAQVKRHHADRISNIKVEFFYGSTVAVFKHFLEANHVDSIILLNNYTYKPLTADSIDPQLLATRSNKHIIYADCKPSCVFQLPNSTNNVIDNVA